MHIHNSLPEYCFVIYYYTAFHFYCQYGIIKLQILSLPILKVGQHTICINWNGNINALYYCTDAMITERSPAGIPELVMGRERNIDNYMKLYDLVMNSVGVIYNPDPDTTYNLPIFRDGLTMYLGGFLCLESCEDKG